MSENASLMVQAGAERRQRGYRLHTWKADPIWEEFVFASPGPGEALVRVEACGVGLTVLNWSAGDLTDDPGLLPRVPGHEVIGTVVETGDQAYEHLLGQRVAAYSYLFCGRCRACIAGQENRCPNLAGWVSLHRDGGYAPFSVLPGRNLIPVDERVDPVSATVIPDAVSTSVHVCFSRAQLTPADRVVVIGAAGGVGIHIVQVARHAGASVVGVDIGPEKLAALERVGCRGVDGRELSDIRGASLWDLGAPTVVIDFVGRESTFAWALDELAIGGRLIVLTTFRDGELRTQPRLMVSRELSVLASRAATRAEYGQAAELVAQGAVQPVIGEVRAPERVLEIHELLRAGALIGRGALDWGADGHS